jgi:hypothetical protein
VIPHHTSEGQELNHATVPSDMSSDSTALLDLPEGEQFTSAPLEITLDAAPVMSGGAGIDCGDGSGWGCLTSPAVVPVEPNSDPPSPSSWAMPPPVPVVASFSMAQEDERRRAKRASQRRQARATAARLAGRIPHQIGRPRRNAGPGPVSLAQPAQPLMPSAFAPPPPSSPYVASFPALPPHLMYVYAYMH